jgi:hypothetical protein
MIGNGRVSARRLTAARAADKCARLSTDFATLVDHRPRPLACLAQELFATR